MLAPKQDPNELSLEDIFSTAPGPDPEPKVPEGFSIQQGAQEIPLDSLFAQPAPQQPTGEEIPLTQIFEPPPVEGVIDVPETRFFSGLNSFASRIGKALFEEFPKTAATFIAAAGQGAAGVVPPVPGVGGTQAQFRNLRDAAVASVPDSPLYQLGEKAGQAVEEMFPENPEFQDEWLAKHIPAMLGDLTGTAVASAVNPVLGLGVGAGTILSQEYDAALKETGDPEVAFKNFLLNLPVGATEAIPVGRFLRRLDNVSGGGVKSILAKSFKGGIEEMTQEVVEQVITNASAGQTYDKAREILDGLGESAGVGFGAGFVLNAVGLSVRKAVTRQAVEGEQPSLDEAVEADNVVPQTTPLDPDLNEVVDWTEIELLEGGVEEDGSVDSNFEIERSTGTVGEPTQAPTLRDLNKFEGYEDLQGSVADFKSLTTPFSSVDELVASIPDNEGNPPQSVTVYMSEAEVYHYAEGYASAGHLSPNGLFNIEVPIPIKDLQTTDGNGLFMFSGPTLGKTMSVEPKDKVVFTFGQDQAVPKSLDSLKKHLADLSLGPATHLTGYTKPDKKTAAAFFLKPTNSATLPVNIPVEDIQLFVSDHPNDESPMVVAKLQVLEDLKMTDVYLNSPSAQASVAQKKTITLEEATTRFEGYVNHPIFGGGKKKFVRMPNPFTGLLFPVASKDDPDIVTEEDLSYVAREAYLGMPSEPQKIISNYIGGDYYEINLVYSKANRDLAIGRNYISGGDAVFYSQQAAVIEEAFTSVRERLRSVYGDTIRLYRYQRAHKTIEPEHGVVGFSVDPKIALGFKGMEGKGILFAVDMPIDRIIWATDTYNEQEFIVAADDELRSILNNKRGAESGRLGRYVRGLGRKRGPIPDAGSIPYTPVEAPIGKKGFVGESVKKKLEPNSPIMVSKRVGSAIAGLIGDVKKAFGIKSRVVVLTVDEVLNDTSGRASEVIGEQAVEYFRNNDDGHSFAIYLRDKSTGTHIIAVRNRGNVKDAVTRELLSHELGHMVKNEFDLLKENEKAVAELDKLYEAFLDRIQGMTLREFLNERRLPGAAGLTYDALKQQLSRRGLDIDSLTVEEFKETSPAFYAYITKKNEWFADEFSKWLSTEAGRGETSSLVGKYMKAFADYMRRLYATIFGKDAATSNPLFNEWVLSTLRAQKIRAAENDGSGFEIEFSRGDDGGRPPKSDGPDGPSDLIKPNTSLEARERALVKRGKEQGDTLRSFAVNPDDDLGAFRRLFQRWLSPRALLPQEAFVEAKKGQARATAEMREAHGRMQEVYKLVDQRTAGEKLRGVPPRIDPDIAAEMDHVLRGSRDGIRQLASDTNRRMSDELFLKVVDMRRHIDRLSKRLIEEGFVEGPLQAKIARNLGFYLHRQYRVHTDPNWAKKVPAEVMNRAKAFIRDRFAQQGRDLLPQEMDTIIRRLLTDNDVQAALLTDRKLVGFDASILRDRKRIPAPIRALWGEIESPVYNYVESIRKIADLLGQQGSLRRIRDLGEGQYFFKRNSLYVPPGYDKRIQAQITDPLHPLAGYVTHPDILESLNEAYGRDKKINSQILDVLLKINGAAKIMKTVGNLMTWSRNFYGGTMWLAANGHNPVKGVGTMARVLKELRKSGVQQSKIDWASLGLLDQSVAGGELADLFRDMNLGGPDLMSNFDLVGDQASTFMNRWVKKPVREATRLYQGIDNLLRVTMFELEYARKKKILYPDVKDKDAPELSELREQVAEQIANTYQNYSRVPRAIRLLRRNPLAGPFVSFPYEAIRTAVNTVKVAKEEIKSENPAMRRLGYLRAFSLMGTVTAGTLATLVSKGMAGIDDETESAIDQLAAPWDRDIGKWYTEVANGVVRYRNLGYTLPFSILERPLITMLFRDDDESFFQAFQKSLFDFFENFLGAEIAAQKAYEVFSNQKEGGAWVVNPELPVGEKAARQFLHFMSAFEPGVVADFQKVAEADYPLEEAGTRATEILMGLREVELDVSRSFMFRAREFNRRRRNVRSIANTVLRNPLASEEEKQRAISTAQEQYELLWNGLDKLYNSAFRLGVGTDELEQVLSDSGIGKQLRRDLLIGDFTPLSFEED